MMEHLYKDLLTITEESSFIVDSIGSTPTINPTRQPSQADVYLAPVVTGNTSAGSIKIIGSQDGTPINEILAVAEGGYCPQSALTYDTVDHLELAGLIDGSVALKQVRGQGEPILQELVIKTTWGTVVAKSGDLRALEAGEIEAAKFILATMDDEALKVLPNRFIYVQQGEQSIKKFKLTFLSPPGRMGNINGDLFLLDADTETPT